MPSCNERINLEMEEETQATPMRFLKRILFLEAKPDMPPERDPPRLHRARYAGR